MKHVFLIISMLICFTNFASAIDDSAASDIGCGGKPKPALPMDSNAADATCVCDSSGVCDWVYVGN